MRRESSHEDIHYSGSVNVIYPDVFPRTFPLHWHNHVELAVWIGDADENVETEETAASSVPLLAMQDTDKNKETEKTSLGTQPTLRVNQTIYQMHPGDILFIWPGEVHEIVENSVGRLTGLQFSAALFNELPDFAPFFHFFRSFHQLALLERPELAQRITEHIRKILSLQESRAMFSGVETVICLYELFMDFGSYIKNTVLEEANPRSAIAGRTFEKISAACGYIIDNCEQELTLESAAAHVGFSACYFSRIFKQFTNYNFVEYLTLQRIKKAQQLLSDPDKAVTEVAYQSGFKSISTFNRVFRQCRGCSPSEYRKYYLR